MKEQIRLRNFLKDLDEVLMDNVDCMIDEEGNPIEHNITEETVYNWMMETEEYHFLGTERVKSIIHSFMTDFRFRMEVLRAYKLV